MPCQRPWQYLTCLVQPNIGQDIHLDQSISQAAASSCHAAAGLPPGRAQPEHKPCRAKYTLQLVGPANTVTWRRTQPQAFGCTSACRIVLPGYLGVMRRHKGTAGCCWLAAAPRAGQYVGMRRNSMCARMGCTQRPSEELALHRHDGDRARWLLVRHCGTAKSAAGRCLRPLITHGVWGTWAVELRRLQLGFAGAGCKMSARLPLQ